MLFQLLLGTWAGCSYPNDDGPLAAASTALRLVRVEPRGGATDVPIDTTLDFYFDQPLDSETVGPPDLRLFSGRVGILGHLKSDLLLQRLRFTPDGDLRADLQYQILLDEGLRGLDGAPLAEPVISGFKTGKGRRVPPPDAPANVTARDLQPLWQTHGCVACHAPPAAAAGVDLSTPQATLRTLRGVSSLGSPLPRVVPGDHAGSYLLRKLLGKAGMTGFPMPPEEPRLPEADLRRVADWIDGGARE